MDTALKSTAIIRDDVQRYLSQVKSGLADVPVKQKVVSDLTESLSDYLENHPEATIEEIHLNFGRPETIVNDNIDEVPVTEVVKSKRVKKLVIAGIAAVILAVVIYFVFCFIDGYLSNRGSVEQMVGEAIIQSRSILTNIGGYVL